MRRTRRSVSRQRRRLLESGGEWKKPSIWSWCSPTIDRFNSSLFIFGEKPHEINLQPSRPKLVSKGEWADYHSLGLDAYVCCCSPVLGAFQIQRALGRPSKVRPLSYLSLLFFLDSIFIFIFLFQFSYFGFCCILNLANPSHEVDMSPISYFTTPTKRKYCILEEPKALTPSCAWKKRWYRQIASCRPKRRSTLHRL